MRYRPHIQDLSSSNYLIGGGGKEIFSNKEEKKEYLHHCYELLYRPNEESKKYLLDKLETVCSLKINELYSSNTVKLNEYLRIIFENIDILDKNYIGVVNIVSLQCSILFTYASIGLSDYIDGGYFFTKSFQRSFESITEGVNFQSLKESTSWLYYKNITTRKKLCMSPIEELYTVHNGLIILIDYISIDKIVKLSIDDKFYCGFCFEKTIADGSSMLPFDFVTHDVSHYYHFSRRLDDPTYKTQTLQKIKTFYEFINTSKDKDVKYACMCMIFLYTHERFDAFFLEDLPKKVSFKTIFLDQAVVTTKRMFERMFDNNDLGLLIPRDYRRSNDTRIEYLNYMIECYKNALTQFKEGKHDFEYNKLQDYIDLKYKYNKISRRKSLTKVLKSKKTFKKNSAPPILMQNLGPNKKNQSVHRSNSRKSPPLLPTTK